MKLLTKSEIVKAKAAETIRDIEEGKKLAKRVDSLREIQAQEEASLEKFRRETLSKLHAEITAKVSERDALTYEVQLLETARTLAQQPLIEETAALDITRRAVRKESEALGQRKEDCAAEANRLYTETIAIDTEKARIIAERSRSTEILDHADSDRKAAASLLKEADTIKSASARFQETMRQEFIHRDMQLAARERDCSIREEHLTTKEADYQVRKVTLEDREGSLARELQRNIL